MGPVTDVPLLDRGSPETEQGPAVANPRIRVCSTVVFSAVPGHARPSIDYLLPSRSGDEHSCLAPWKRDMRVDQSRRAQFLKDLSLDKRLDTGYHPSQPTH